MPPQTPRTLSPSDESTSPRARLLDAGRDRSRRLASAVTQTFYGSAVSRPLNSPAQAGPRAFNLAAGRGEGVSLGVLRERLRKGDG